jgi:DNA-binding XRE family transcriptional regulator
MADDRTTIHRRRRTPTRQIRDTWKFGHMLREKREAANFVSMAEAAEEAGLSRQTWTNLETGWAPGRTGGVKEYSGTADAVVTAARTVGWDVAEALELAGHRPPNMPGALLQITNPPVPTRKLANKISAFPDELRRAFTVIAEAVVPDELERELVDVMSTLTPTQRQKLLASAKRYAAANEKEGGAG